MSNLCDEQQLQELVSMMNSHEKNGLQQISELLLEFPDDPRLHFLKGSILVGEGQLVSAYASLARAVEIAPEYAIARFQLGFFQLTSGEAENALETWKPLDALADDYYLKIFVVGLRHLINDEIPECVTWLEKGISLNTENIPLNGDMNLLIENCRPLLNENVNHEDEEVTSATSFFLNQYSDKGLKH